MENLSCGVELTAVPDIVQALDDAKMEGFDFVALPIAHPRYSRDFTGLVDRMDAWTRSDILLNSGVWSNVVVGKISPWIDLDSPDPDIRFNSRKAFKQEIAWATHLSLPAVLLPAPSMHSINYAQCVNQALLGLARMGVWLRIPLVSPEISLSETQEARMDPVRGRKDEPWEWWNNFRTLCENSPNLGVVLDITNDLPDAAIIDQWLGEPVRAAILPTSIFLINKAGFPTLSKRHQSLVLKLFNFKVQFLIHGSPKHKHGIKDYVQYLVYLWKQRPGVTEESFQEAPYLDYLQSPLQPLMDNLESQTYEIFEKDPVKYKMYQEAVYQALQDKFPADYTPVVMVVGAGRGPLVRASRAAAQQAKRNIKVYAVEKNPNAVVSLLSAKNAEKWTNVTIVDSDMREWDAPEEADILVSELLGSFGDNELSPECLDGAQKFLKDTGISIPCAYTSYLSPISSEKLHNEAKTFGDLQHFETPYVVKYHNANVLATSQPCFTFVHPNVAHPAFPKELADNTLGAHSKTQLDNSRYTKLVFDVAINTTLHGFAGYFDAKLYKDVHISINPANFSEGMFSWFPIYFPLRHPMHISAGTKVEAHIWRNMSKQKVWYEWCVSAPDVSPIHNPNGRSYWIGL
jgi:protein arginine N-methyltransferase 5